jgi:predicted RNase H-like HicB family nuclease
MRGVPIRRRGFQPLSRSQPACPCPSKAPNPSRGPPAHSSIVNLAILRFPPNLQAVRNVHYTLYREESDYVAQCLDYDVSSFGATEVEAISNLKEALELYLEDLPESAITPKITEVTVGELAIA